MSSSSAGPARFLLNSFTVAATPQTLSVSNAEDEDRSDGTALTDEQDADAQVYARPTTAAFPGASSTSVEEEEEEPRPSSAAPQPAPAPPPSSQPASSTQVSLEWLSSPIVNTSPHSRRYSFSLHSRPPMWGAPMGSRVDSVGRTGDDLRGIPAPPFRWRSSLPCSAGTSLLKLGQHDFRHAATTTATLHPGVNSRHVSEPLGRSPTGAFTPHIRYRTSSGGPPGARAASGGLSTSDANPSVNCDGESRHRHVSPVRHAPAESAPHASIPSAHAVAPFLRPAAPAWSFLLHPHDSAQGASFLPPPPLLATTHQGGAAVSTMSPGGGTATRSARAVTLCVPAETTAQEDSHAARRTRRCVSSPVSSAPSAVVAATSSISDVWVQQERRNQARRRGHGEFAEEAEATADVTRSSTHASVNHAGAGEDDGGDSVTEPIAIGHLTLRSLTEEYNRFSTECTVGWIGLQVHLRRHTQTSQIFALDLTCCHLRRDQWTWFSQDILPQLRALEVLRLVQMHLEDDEVAGLVRGSCGLSAAANDRRRAGGSWQQASFSASRHKVDSSQGGSGSGDPAVQSAPLAHLRVLDLSGNAFTQRSCTHLGKMMLWMAGTLEEVRLLGNPLKDYGMQTLSVYVAKLNLEALEQDPSLFPAALRDCCAQVSQKCGRGHARRSRMAGPAPSFPQPAAAAGVVHAGYSEDESRGDARGLVAALPLGPVLLDLRDCRASARGLSDILAAASRAHRLRTLVLSHNVAGVTSLLPLPASAYHEAANLAKGEAMEFEEREARARSGDGRGPLPRLWPLPCRLRLAKTPLVYSGVLMRRQHTAFSDVAEFAPSCALSTLVLYGVPLSQTCSPLGFRALLLNIFFSCPLLDLVDLSDTFEWSLVSPEAQKALLAEANCRDAVEQRLRSPEAQRGLHVHREDQGEVEFSLDSATVSNQTRLGDMFGELMANVAFNAVVRRRLPPAAFLHVRELHLSNTGLTDAGACGLCVSVRRGRTQTGMLASLAVLNLSDNLLTVRGCVRVISTFLLDGDAEVDVDATRSCPASSATTSTAGRPVVIARLTALALQRNSGFVSARGTGTVGGFNGVSDDGAEHLQRVCTAAETAVLRRATLRSAVCSNQVYRSSSSGAANADAAIQEERAPPLMVYFSAPPSVEATSSISSSGAGGQRRPSASLPSTASVDVFYAGCDDQGDVYCTCPCSRFYVAKPASAQAVEKKDIKTRGPPYFAQQKPCSSTEVSRALAGTETAHGDQTASALAVSEMARGGCGALGTDATPTAGEKQQHHAQGGPQRNLFAALGAPRDAVAAAGTGAGGESPNGLVNTTPLHHLRNLTSDVEAGAAVSAASASSSSFPLVPPPPSDSMSVVVAAQRTSDLAAAGVGPHFVPPQQQQQTALPSRREDGLSVPSGSSFGELFMSKAEKTPPVTLGAPAGAAVADAAAAVPVAANIDVGADVSDTLVSTAASARRLGGRRARLRRTRTFVLSYDHVAGHLFCRALGVLLRPPPDPLGEGARAALEQDLLAALKRASAASKTRSTSEQGGDKGGDDGGGVGKTASATTTAESVRYLPPEPPSATVADGGDSSQLGADVHWMRFEVTTSERKGDMAQRLQEVLNVPLSEQRVLFERLLQFLTQHVTCGGEPHGALTAEDLWDPVRAIEQAARSSAAVRARLEIAYGGVAEAAVHARHQYHGAADATLVPINDAGGCAASATTGALDGTDGTEGIVRLERLYFALWRELGMPVGDTARDALPHLPPSVCMNERGTETPVGSDGRPDLLDRATDGGGLHTSFSTPHDVPSCLSSEAAVALSPQPSAATHPPRPHVVNFYDGVGGKSKPRQRQSLPATVHQGQCAGAFAPAAATGGDQGGAKWTTSGRERAEREEGDEGTSVDSTSVTTPEKQFNHAHCIELGSPAAALSPSPLALANSNVEALQPDSPSVEVVLTDKVTRLSPPAKTCDAAGAAGAAVAPPLTPQQPVSRASLMAAEEDEKGQQHVDDFNAERNALRALTSRLLIDKRSDEERSGSSGRAGSPARSGGTLLSQPQQEQSEGCQRTQPEPVHAGATGVQAEEAEGEEDIAIVSPIRLQRRSSQLIGRVKTFTLSYTHQEGTAVCRAWRLLHTATHVCRIGSANSNTGMSVAPADAVAPIAPSSPPSLATLAKEAQRCLCDDFLAFLQPPDEGAEHAVLSVSLRCDSGVATSMLQVQVQTNERRAVLADRLQHSNHGVRRGVGRGSRSGLVPLSVQEVDQLYFPRLTRLLCEYKTVADTAAQVQAFLQPRAAVQARLLQSHGSVAALVHYYHGSPTALEHELGISSWQVLMDPAPQSTARAEQLTEEVLSPTVTVDRVLRRERAGVEGNQGGSAPREGSGDTGEHAPGTPFPQGANATPSSPPQPTAAGTRQPSCPTSADGSVAGATNRQGRPPPHPRRLPTPPHAITHTSSISFDEVTEEPTSESGPVVVLRGTAPTPAQRSPSSPQSLNPQYFPAMYRQAVSTTLPSRAGVEDVRKRSALNEPGGQPDGGSDTGLVSPLTAVSSAAGSPTAKYLGLVPEQPAPTGAVAASEASLSPLPVPCLVRQPAEGTDSVAAPASKKGGDSTQLRRSDASGNPSAAAVTAPSSSPSVMSPSKTRPVGGTNAAASLVLQPRLPVERDHSNTAGHSNASSRSLEPSQRQPGAAAGAGSSSTVAGSDRCTSEYERVLEGKYKRLMRVAYDGVARGSVPLDPQHQQKTVIGRGKWGAQKVELSLEWEILFVLTFEKSRKLGRSSRRAQMLVHPVGCGFECAAGDDPINTASSGIYGGDTSSLHSSAINGESGDGGHHPPATAMSKIPRKRESSKSAASHLIITIQRPFTPDEVGSSSHDMEKTLMAGALLTVSSSSKAAWLLVGGNDDTSTTSRASAGVNQVTHEYVFQLCQASLTLDIEMKSSKHVQEALRLLKNSIRRATQAVKKSMLNAHLPPPSR